PTPEQRKAARTQALRQGALLLVVVAGALYGARDFVTPWFLGSQFREAVDRHGDWLDLGVRQQVRTDMACLGRTKTLRVLSWLGVEGRASPRDAALGCAAFHGQVDAVETLVALGEDIDRPADAIDSPLPVALQTPLQQAVRAPAGLPAAEWLLAHGAKPRPAAAVADPVQTAAAANCLACIEWLRQHGLPMDGAEPATPLALWLDRPASQGGADVATVTRLIGLGMSPSAIGADGRSALHAAAAAGNGPVVELLLARGADPAHADHDGMKPLFYAAAGLGRDQGAGADAHERRLAVVLRLLAATPSLAGQGVPAPAHSHPVIAADPYIHQPYDFDLTAAAEPRIRSAADEAGKTIHYTDGAFLEGLPAPEARALLARMADADIARVMAPGASFAAFAAKAGWWPELLRGVRGWAPSTSHADYRWRPDCEVLRAAVEGPGDASPGRADSWAVVDAWLDAGMRPSGCNAGTGSVPSALARRPPAQQADWAARTGSGGSSARP
ncbi:MAG: ankyrin repeat domain-containing protein, partial [Vitreoscilla sp.]